MRLRVILDSCISRCLLSPSSWGEDGELCSRGEGGLTFHSSLCELEASLVAQRVKCLSAVWETWVRSLAQENPLEKEIATHSSILYSPWGHKELDTTELLPLQMFIWSSVCNSTLKLNLKRISFLKRRTISGRFVGLLFTLQHELNQL